ncbi:MATE efflux family protein [[Clostridium] cellulosi]|uniref:MATE efflux family protein n=1 Tax=[Clostridium] cellulosi TaxID=29343 RepID=A0A078KSA8_9FIRM|nr:MATE efflux family protein [[Clostridium] cellulosi]
MKLSIVRDKEFYKMLITITIPIALQNLISFGLNMVDTVMLGSLGENQISASSIANQPYFIFTVFMFGLASGACVLTAQYWGKGDTNAISKIMTLAIRASVICSLFFAFIVLVFSEGVIGFYTQDKDVIVLGAQFLRIIGFSYILSAISTTYLYILRSIENVTVPLIINSISFVVNVALNWVLIFGKFGFPAMGIRGSATATLFARITELILTVIYASFFDKRLRIKLSDFLVVDKLLLKDFLHYSLPVVINETLWALGQSMQSVVIGHISSEVVAANSIAGVVQRLATVLIMGVANFTAIAVGKQIGAGNIKTAENYASTLLILSALLGVVSSAIILIIREPFLTIYSVGGATRSYTLQILGIYALTTLFSCFNSTNIVGVLRGGGDTRFAMYLDLVVLWFAALPLGGIAGLILKLPIPLVFFFLTIDEPIKLLIGLARFKSKKWARNVTR